MAWRNQVALLVVLGVYVLFGGVVFHILEYGRHEVYIQRETVIRHVAQEFINLYDIESDDLYLLIRQVIHASRGYRDPLVNDPAVQDDLLGQPVWDLPNSIFFATTVITTIGYGALCPVTLSGRIFCVFYGMFGIPLFLLTLSDVGSRVNIVTQVLVDRIANRYHTPKLSRSMRAFFIVSFGSVVFLLFPAAMFAFMENWTYGEGVYYAFVTLSTIGFGDFIAGTDSTEDYPAWYILARQCWLFLGLAWLSAAIGVNQEVFQSICGRGGRLQHSAEKILYWKNHEDCHSSDEDTVEVEYI